MNVFEEDVDTGVHRLVSVLAAKLLPNAVVSRFARAFDVRGQVILLSVGSTAREAGLAYFRHDTRSGSFSFVSTITAPTDAVSNGEIFGESIVLGPHGLALVGSPTADRARGGRIYVMTQNTEDIWDVQQAVSDPWQSPDVQFPNTGVFGRFVHADRDFTLVSVSANRHVGLSVDSRCPASCAPECDEACSRDPQSSVCVFEPTTGAMLGPCTQSAVVIFSMDQRRSRLITEVERTQRLFQEQSSPTQFVDPLFGRDMSIVTNTDIFQGARILIGSEMNQVLSTWVM